MGSLQNLNRSGSSLVQLSRAAVVANQSSLAPGSGNPSLMGFNSAVGGGRITPTSSGSAASVSGNFLDFLIIRKKMTSFTNLVSHSADIMFKISAFWVQIHYESSMMLQENNPWKDTEGISIYIFWGVFPGDMPTQKLKKFLVIDGP